MTPMRFGSTEGCVASQLIAVPKYLERNVREGPRQTVDAEVPERESGIAARCETAGMPDRPRDASFGSAEHDHGGMTAFVWRLVERANQSVDPDRRDAHAFSDRTTTHGRLRNGVVSHLGRQRPGLGRPSLLVVGGGDHLVSGSATALQRPEQPHRIGFLVRTTDRCRPREIDMAVVVGDECRAGGPFALLASAHVDRYGRLRSQSGERDRNRFVDQHIAPRDLEARGVGLRQRKHCAQDSDRRWGRHTFRARQAS